MLLGLSNLRLDRREVEKCDLESELGLSEKLQALPACDANA